MGSQQKSVFDHALIPFQLIEVLLDHLSPVPVAADLKLIAQKARPADVFSRIASACQVSLVENARHRRGVERAADRRLREIRRPHDAQCQHALDNPILDMSVVSENGTSVGAKLGPKSVAAHSSSPFRAEGCKIRVECLIGFPLLSDGSRQFRVYPSAFAACHRTAPQFASQLVDVLL
jgi:hypothetical protein